MLPLSRTSDFTNQSPDASSRRAAHLSCFEGGLTCRLATPRCRFILFLQLLHVRRGEGITLRFCCVVVSVSRGWATSRKARWHSCILSHAVLYYTILYYTILYYTILYYTILYYTILYYTILYYTILYYTILYYTILYYTILYYTILYYTILD